MLKFLKMIINDDYNSLILPSNILDESTKQYLEIIFASLWIITRRMLDNLLEGRKQPILATHEGYY